MGLHFWGFGMASAYSNNGDSTVPITTMKSIPEEYLAALALLLANLMFIGLELLPTIYH